jgi:hypothetical protein
MTMHCTRATQTHQIRSMLSGDASKVYEITEDDPNQPPPVIGEDGEVVPDEEGPKKLVFQIPELAVLRLMIDSINSACGVVPVVSGGSTMHTKILRRSHAKHKSWVSSVPVCQILLASGWQQYHYLRLSAVGKQLKMYIGLFTHGFVPPKITACRCR